MRVQCTKYDRIDVVMPPEEEPKKRQGVVNCDKRVSGYMYSVHMPVGYSLPLVVSEGDSLGGHLEVDYSGGWCGVGVQSHTGGFLHRLDAC